MDILHLTTSHPKAKNQTAFWSGSSDTVEENPYRLCEIKGFGFITVDSIAETSKDLARMSLKGLKRLFNMF